MLKLALLILGTCILAQTSQIKSEPISKEISDSFSKFEAKNTKLICDATGICQGNLIGVFTRPSKQDCITLCHNEISCTWLSFSDMEKNCLTYSSCPELDESYESYVTGQEGCYKEPSSTTTAIPTTTTAIPTTTTAPGTGFHVMITTGVPTSSARKTEVVDVVNGETCADLADFPVTNGGAVGANLNGTPIVCGGYFYPSVYYQKCYKFTNGGWQEFASMNEKRGHAAGIMFKNKFHVFGGYDGSSRLQTSEIISIDGAVEYGPELPEAVWLHAITSINSTVSLLSGGDTGDYSPLTWFFNHETQAFSSGPSLLEGRYAHGSATIVDKVTKAKIPMVTGGYANSELDSTELLINGMWQSGPPLPKALCCFSMLEIHGDAYIFGGYDGSNFNSAIYQLTCSSGICSWSTLNQELKVAREYTVAIRVPNNFCT